MDEKIRDIIEECAEGSRSGRMVFPQVVAKLAEAGVSRYHADFDRAEVTWYHESGESHRTPLVLPSAVTGGLFDTEAMRAAIRAAQQGAPYSEFLANSLRAGCIGYPTFIDGRRVVYYGATGDMHTEHFPTPARPAE